MPEQLASLYGQTLSLMLFNIVLPVLITPLPSVIVSANLLKEGNTFVLEREGEMKRLLNMVIIAVATPMLSFLICVIMQWLYNRPYFFWVLVLFVILVCLLVRLSYTQYKKGKLFSRMLNDELKHRDEVSNEINRLDVMAVTSQFDSMSREIDFKHREIIDLSLFVRQQREYMTGVGEQLRELAQNTDTENIRRSLVEIDRDLQETLRYPPEMEKIYQQVEKMHHDFACRLQMRCPNLTKRECRLAILLRLGFSSKEIANMVNLETKSVEINRYRLRKKLRLDRSENLVNYLQLL
jgi:DNA-binding CsgD family transcriptional regulator/ABC-type multidrug transport system fused ATPase/permease subunit